jgi:hypothetical protein
MSAEHPTEDDYYATLDGNLQAGAYDLVADLEEWRRFKRALLRWIDDQEREWNRHAIDDKHGNE